jgi:hypothetical protein
MSDGLPDLRAFVLRVFLWLAPCFAAWYLCAHAHTALVAAFARLIVAFFNGMLVSGTENAAELVFVTRLVVQRAGETGFLTVDVNPLIYTYGLALFLALMLGARARWTRVLLGAAILLPFQGWGVAFDFLAQVGAKMGPQVAAQAGLLGAREAIALAYQLGNLVFPSVVPVVVWVALEKRFLESLLGPRMRGPDPPPAAPSRNVAGTSRGPSDSTCTTHVPARADP